MPHNHIDPEDYTSQIEKASKISIILNILFVIIEIVGGLYTNSIAILSDAVHDMGDVITLIVSYVLIKFSKREENKNYNFGLKGSIVLGAALNTLIILITSVLILINSFSRLMNPQIINGNGMFLIALFGVILNGISVYKFHNKDDVMSKSIMLHLLEDALGWIAVLISSILIMVFKVYIIDTILSLAIATFLIINCIRNIVNVAKVILYRVPDSIDYKEIEMIVLQSTGVDSIHDMKIWSLEGKTNYCILNINVDDNLSFKQIEQMKREVKAKISEKGIQKVIIEVGKSENE